ncbi:hypothetical protein [Streptomyces wuyuanensis]|uniref:hypothetical protein n=1 Tax=Streptomyces wuyuanensis TaxID=1196353 RepID=UPI0037A3CD7D
MSAPTTRDPLKVTTSEGAVWTRRGVNPQGRGLYAFDGVEDCPSRLLVTLAELAEYGVRSADELAAVVAEVGALPMPVGNPAPPALSHIPDYGHGTEVNGCRHCGVPEREHMQRWSRRDGERGPGWHTWTQPTQEQIKERMRRRRSVAQLRSLLAGQQDAVATEGALAEQRHLMDPLDHAFEHLAPHGFPETGAQS